MSVPAHPAISIIIPLLNEAAELPTLLTHLAIFRQRACEVLLVDGGSTDNSVALAEQAGFTVIPADQGRARQMNAGTAVARAEILLFLHADTRLPENADQIIKQALTTVAADWGRFDVRIQGTSAMLSVIAFMMNLRSRLTGIATGDQAIFVRRNLFAQVGRFPDQPLMEDIELSTRLKRVSAPVCLRDKVTTSGRRWEARGVVRTVLLMMRLRLAYYLGVSADQLARVYR